MSYRACLALAGLLAATGPAPSQSPATTAQAEAALRGNTFMFEDDDRTDYVHFGQDGILRTLTPGGVRMERLYWIQGDGQFCTSSTRGRITCGPVVLGPDDALTLTAPGDPPSPVRGRLLPGNPQGL